MKWKWKLCLMFILVHIEYVTPLRHSLKTPAKGDNKDLAEGEDKNYPSRLEELTISRRQALAMNEDNYRNQGQGVRPKVRTGQTNRGLEMTLNQQNEPWWSSDLSQLRDQSIAIQNLWISEGRPRHGPTYLERLRVKAAYKRSIRAAKTAFKQAAWVRQNPVSGQKPVATGGNGWQTNQITAQNQNLPTNVWPDYWSNLPNLPAKPARPQHNALRSRSLSTIPEVHEVPQQSWRPQAQSPFSLFHRNGARYFLEQARSQPRRRYPAGTRPILNQVPDVFAKWRNWQKRPQTTE